MRAISSKESIMPVHGRQNKQKGTSLILGTASLVFIIPMIGLFIDVGIMYAVKSRLQASVDGASLAAARALTLGATTTAQSGTAKQNALNWFYANYPPGTWTTTGTVMGLSNVTVADDPTNPNLRNVTVTATTNVPSYFMKFLNVGSTTLTATGNASRRDVVAMMVLDRSGSMGATCAALLTAAKQFTGQFAAGRDRIGLVSFSDGVSTPIAPATDFQTTLGYTNSVGTGNGAIDTIQCNGGTGSAAAISVAYNELYKKMLPGALNLIMFETDGLPNTLAYNWWDGSTTGLNSASPCTDVNGRTKSSGTPGWTTLASQRAWVPGHSMNTGGTGFMADIPAGAYGSFYSSDPSSARTFYVLYNPWQTTVNTSNNSVNVDASAVGCGFAAAGAQSSYNDFDWLPATDIFGNSVKPANAYQSITLTSGHVNLVNSVNTDWASAHAAALNATDNAAYRARTNATLPVHFFVIGLGGNGSDNPDYILLQRIANDPSGDPSAANLWQTCSSEPTCLTYTSQPGGTFIFAPDSTQLGHAFLEISAQILRLSR
jgi:Flp pilus assembly protein TadG